MGKVMFFNKHFKPIIFKGYLAMDRTVTLEKQPLSLMGRSLEMESPAPRFTAVSLDLQDVTLESYGEKIKLIIFFPSIDHPACDLQVRETNRYAADLHKSVAVIGISRDTPLALKRFKETFDIRNIELISDQRYGSFGVNYGVLIRELNLLTRGAMILDMGNILRYRQIVRELSNQPDFNDIFEHLQGVVRDPLRAVTSTFPHACTPSKGVALLLSSKAISTMLRQVPGWELVAEKKIAKQFSFKDFADAKEFLDIVAAVSEEQKHHPSFMLNYNRLSITLTTNEAGGLTENDFIMARIIDQLQ